ncbi:hypothetical protein HanRHA438_Chr16g0755501 [Helianthus annuus]|nr:hypothetical protein HanRHA438_Chr16g0755501 [Helianthus annuus]
MKNLLVMLFFELPIYQRSTHSYPRIILNRYHITHPNLSLVILTHPGLSSFLK